VKLTKKEVQQVAELANLALGDDEINRMAQDLDSILIHVDKLSELDTSSVEPMAQVLYQALPASHAVETQTLREDIERPPLGNTAALANAPLAGGGYFKVPRVIERS
jgi:aspartyl-tRNA(Asn)/glutamyl-tRNA(Gln) amidotransferase subunit C